MPRRGGVVEKDAEAYSGEGRIAAITSVPSGGSLHQRTSQRNPPDLQRPAKTMAARCVSPCQLPRQETGPGIEPSWKSFCSSRDGLLSRRPPGLHRRRQFGPAFRGEALLLGDRFRGCLAGRRFFLHLCPPGFCAAAILARPEADIVRLPGSATFCFGFALPPRMESSFACRDSMVSLI